MVAWLAAHVVDILLILAVAVVVALIVRRSVKNKKAGKHTCGCDCANCSLHGACHGNNQPTDARS